MGELTSEPVQMGGAGFTMKPMPDDHPPLTAVAAALTEGGLNVSARTPELRQDANAAWAKWVLRHLANDLAVTEAIAGVIAAEVDESGRLREGPLALAHAIQRHLMSDTEGVP